MESQMTQFRPKFQNECWNVEVVSVPSAQACSWGDDVTIECKLKIRLSN